MLNVSLYHYKSAVAFNFCCRSYYLAWKPYCPLPSLILLYNLSETSNRRIFDSVLVFFLQVIIHKCQMKVCRLSVVRFLTSEYRQPREHRKPETGPSQARGSCRASRYSSWCVSPLSCQYTCPRFRRLIYPAKGLNSRRPSFLAMEMMCFNTII